MQINFSYLNKYLNSYLNCYRFSEYAIFVNELNYFYQITKLLHNYTEDIIVNYYENNFQYNQLSKDETINLVSNFFETIDDKMLKQFNEALEQDKIKFENNNIDKISFTTNLNGIGYSKVFLNYNITDAFTLVHEATHLLNIEDRCSAAWLLFTEGYANTFEMLLYNYLLKQKYNIDELNNYYNNLIWCHQISVIRFITSGNILKLENKYQYVDDDLIDRLDISDIEKKKLLTGLRDIYFSLTNNNEITNPFGDLSYNIGLLYSNILLSKFPNNKDIILDEYYNLSKYDEEYLLNKYLKCRELKPTKKLDKMLKIKR